MTTTSYSKKIKELEEEAQAHLTLYTNGQDDNALIRYNHIMSAIRTLRDNERKRRS